MMGNEGIRKRCGDGISGLIHLTTSRACNLPKDRRLAADFIGTDTADPSGNRPDDEA
jgi:hypothetical protein